MTIHKALHPREDIDSLFVPQKEKGRGLACIDDFVDASIERRKKHGSQWQRQEQQHKFKL